MECNREKQNVEYNMNTNLHRKKEKKKQTELKFLSMDKTNEMN
jgi:hypothetical protein